MTHNALHPGRKSQTERYTAPLHERALLDRGEFRAAIVADLAGMAVDSRRGDAVLVRQVGHFAVLVHLRHPEGPSSVWTATVVSGRLVWGEPKLHPDRRAAALDALKLVNSFQPGGMAGD